MKTINYYRKAGLILAIGAGTWMQASAQKDTLASVESNVWPKDTIIFYPKDTVVIGGNNDFPKDTSVTDKDNDEPKDTIIFYPKDTVATGGNNDFPKDTLVTDKDNDEPKGTIIFYPKDTVVTGGNNDFPKDTSVTDKDNDEPKDTIIFYPKDTVVTGGNNDFPKDTSVTDKDNDEPKDTVISKGIRYDLEGSGNLIAPIIKNGNYAWFYKDTLVLDSTNHTFRPTKKGKYKVVINWDNATANMRTAENTSVTYEFEVTQLPVPLGFENSNVLNETNSVYPNPASEVAFINAKGAFEYSIETANTELISSGAGNDLVQLDLSGMNAGIYFVRIKSNEKQTVRRLVVR